MPASIPSDSVGLVTAHTLAFNEPLALDCGRSLPSYEIIYETYGHLNAQCSNAILLCHALSSDHHAAGYRSMDDKKPGWWDACVGPGKPMDSNHFFIVCLNNLGGCSGSSGPTSINTVTGKRYGPDFPVITVRDWVNSQVRLGKALGITQWAAVIGGSLGGMQALQWAIDYPDLLRHAIVIAAASKLSAQNIAFNEVARQAIMSDPAFFDGHYHDHGVVPRHGLMLARMLGHITYLSDDAMRAKFGRELREDKLNFSFDVEFQVQSYLRYQGQSFVDRFDANTYLLMTKVLDYFDPAREFNDDLSAAFKPARAGFLVISFTSDWRFSPQRSREIVQSLQNNNRDVSYAEIESSDGHDAFLMPIPRYLEIVRAYLQRVAEEVAA